MLRVENEPIYYATVLHHFRNFAYVDNNKFRMGMSDYKRKYSKAEIIMVRYNALHTANLFEQLSYAAVLPIDYFEDLLYQVSLKINNGDTPC